MSTPTLEELFTPLTRDQVLASEISIAQQLGMPVTAWQPVSIAREILYINAQTCADFSTTTSATARGGYLDYATRGWLTLLADQLFDVQRIESSSATGPIKLVNGTATPYTLAVGSVRILNETSGKTYTNTTGGTLTASGDLTLDYLADEPGTASDLTETDPLSLVVSIPGVTVEWVQNLVGQDEETDPSLRERCRESNAARSPNGPADAYNYFAKTTTRPDGSFVGVTRTNVIQGNRTITVYIADADGAMISQDVAYVQANLNEKCTPTGFTCFVASAATKPITIAMTVTKATGSTASTSDLETLITAAISGYFSGIAVGGAKTANFKGIYLSTLVTLARNACGDNAINVVVTNPLADVALAANQVPVINGSITFTWVTA